MWKLDTGLWNSASAFNFFFLTGRSELPWVKTREQPVWQVSIELLVKYYFTVYVLPLYHSNHQNFPKLLYNKVQKWLCSSRDDWVVITADLGSILADHSSVGHSCVCIHTLNSCHSCAAICSTGVLMRLLLVVRNSSVLGACAIF